MGPIHALVLQLVAKEIIGIEVLDHTKIGSDKLLNDQFVVYLPNATDATGAIVPAYTIASKYDSLTFT